MNPSQSLARPLLASMFVVGGIDSIRNSESKVKVAEAVTKPFSQALPIMPDDTETLVKLNGAVQVGAGLLLATGKMPRLASLALIGSIIPTTYAGHRFWEETDEDRRKQQLIHFSKNLGLLGGLLLELNSGPKKRRGSKNVRAEAKRLKGKAKRLEARAERSAKHAAAEASKFASRTATDVTKGSKRAAKRTQDLAGQFAPIAGQYAQQYAQSASHYAQSATDHAGQLVSYAQDHLNSLKAA
jgi:putative oxidoreductase